MIDKSTKQHYEIQGKVKNYLGKQKMVKAPLYWRSGAKHPKTELAYITKKEKDLLIKKDLHKSLKGGVNRGPSGIISLNGWGDKGDFGGSSGGGGNGSTNRERGIQQSYSAPAPTRSPQASQAREEKAKADKARDEERANVREQARTKITAPKALKSTITDRTVTSFKGPMDLKVKTPPEDAREKRISEQYKGIREVGGDAEVATKIALEDEKFTEEELKKGITDDGRIIEYIGDKAVTNKKAKEFSLGLKERDIKTGEIQRGRNIIHPITQQIQSKFAPIDTPKKGSLGTLGNIALGVLAPALLPAKLAKTWSTYNQLKGMSKVASKFTGKDIVGDLTKNLKSNVTTDLLSGKKYTPKDVTPTDFRDDRFRRGDDRQVITEPPKDVITESIQKFTPEHLNLLHKRYAELNKVIESGEYMGQKLNNNQLVKLIDASQQLKAFLVDPQKMMMMAKGGLAGLHG